jgi:ankyrin repeat protein
MIRAIQDGDPKKLQQLIDSGIAVEPRAADGVSQCKGDGWDALCYRPLYEAFQQTSGPAELQLLRPLLAAGADIHAVGDDGSTVLHAMLVDWSASYYELGVPGEANPKNRFAQWLIEHSPVDIAATDNYGQTVLHVATAKHNMYMLRWMLEFPKTMEVVGSLVNARDLAGNTALHYAAGGDHWFPALSKSLMFTTMQASKHHINYNNPPKFNGWENSCMEGFYEVADANKGNASSLKDVTGILTAENCRYFSSTIGLLLEHGAAASANVANSGFNTPLHIAANSNDPVSVKMLIAAGADPSLRNRFGQTAATLATVMGNFEALAALPSLAPADQTDLAAHETTRILQPGQAREGAEGPETCDSRMPADTGGWDLPTVMAVEDAGGPNLGGDDGCGIDTFTADNFTAAKFELYIALRRPVRVVGGLPEGVTAHTRWRRTEFMRRYGHLPAMVGQIPYANSFGRGGETSTTFGDYIRYMETDGATDAYPKYIFARDAQSLRLAADAGLWDLSFVNASRVAQHSFQFYLGGPKTGAPNHYHSHAINVLLYGQKRWFLTPPRHADYSRLAPVEFLEQEVHALGCVPSVATFADGRGALCRCRGGRTRWFLVYNARATCCSCPQLGATPSSTSGRRLDSPASSRWWTPLHSRSADRRRATTPSACRKRRC